ncbi:DUF262 domain-containing protein [Cypionkella sp.]|uniref:GmrSD restriction endonuclease domain-containing protein n=1 Tax=Cypionkella sp. TaxID=2811411 RepID=UPI002719A4D4|nr:DUF262 domain-containing protein [Cypionkella sp.]MDO8985653.1 DUF262 domain-containing protein [Cypionkella sp.]MDP2049083.1 DUF262 domain-containing protein [Cypionkella sp.]
MKATEAKLLDFLKKSPQFVIPIYQRTYSWTEQECRQLWEDILRTGANNSVSAHFVGSIVYIEKGLYQVMAQPPLLVIDGQQRLTSVMLILEALARHLGETEPVDGFSARKLRSYYLLNPLEEGERAFKLLLTQTDKASLLALMQQKPLPTPKSQRIAENYTFFEDRVKALGGDLVSLCNGLAKLVIVDIALNRDQDNPQLIFESMNSTGRELSQADLIRNYVLMGLEPVHQTRIYEDNWHPMEVAFPQEAYGSHFDGFMRHYLTVKTGEIPNVRDVYAAFKAYAREKSGAAQGVDDLVADIHIFADHYGKMAFGKEQDRDLALAFQDLRDLKVDVAYPFLLELYADYVKGVLAKTDFVRAVRLVEAYVFRRAICAIPPNSLNKTFATFARELRKDRYLESIEAHLMTLPSYRRFPNDDEFRLEMSRRDLYNFRSRSYWLRRLENDGRKERVPVDEYTIEHILPQNENLSVEWRSALGEDWQTVQETWLHTLGNLTLTGYNAEYSDRPFLEKRDMIGGFKESPLRLNEGLAAVDAWNEAAIRDRADRLAIRAAQVWSGPKLSPAIVAELKPKAVKAQEFTLADHPSVAVGGSMRPLFEALRKEVLALDPCVTEEIVKSYIAFKAETNFLDVVAQAKRLRLSFNMKFHELHDEKGMARDMTNIGHYGNGDVEIAVSSIEELPYIMGLVRQAFEKQMAETESPL